MKKKIVCAVLALMLMVSYMPTCGSTSSGFVDVPSGHWAEEYIVRASQLGIMQGTGSATFGLGTNVTRAQFAAMLTRLFSWEKLSPVTPSFSDNADTSAWYYSEIETALSHGAIAEAGSFRPNDRITRAEMAVMLVRALGYGTLAENAGNFGMTFTDVGSDRGYITLASDFGIITGLNETTFDPNGYALREQAAAMMVRLYDRYMSAELWNHAFYAISSYSQRHIISRLDGVSFGWSKLQYTPEGGVLLNTTSAGGNEFNIPSAADAPVSIAAQNSIPHNLSVFMSTSQTVESDGGAKSNACAEILLSGENRTEAIRQIINAANNPELSFSGVTIDFEEMRSNLASGFTAFLSELKAALGDRPLYVCVHPKLRSGGYYDGYDFRELGRICDKIIVMAHDYQAKSLTPELMAQGFTTTPVTPFEDVYYALKSVTDKSTGVEDTSKIALAISIGSVGWSLRDGAVVNSSGMRPVPEDIIKRLESPATVINYSERYRNPYITYYDESDDTDNIVWYEDMRSIGDKIALARMFGITGVSYWRLGLLPDYSASGGRDTYYNVVNLIK